MWRSAGLPWQTNAHTHTPRSNGVYAGKCNTLAQSSREQGEQQTQFFFGVRSRIRNSLLSFCLTGTSGSLRPERTRASPRTYHSTSNRDGENCTWPPPRLCLSGKSFEQNKTRKKCTTSSAPNAHLCRTSSLQKSTQTHIMSILHVRKRVKTQMCCLLDRG